MLLSVNFLVVTAFQSNDTRALARNAMPMTATVFDAREAGTPDNPSFLLSYQFKPDGQIVTNERPVPRAFCLNHPTGTTWDIQVHPDDTGIHDLYAGETRATAWGFLLVSLLMAAFGLTLALSNGTLAAIRAMMNRSSSGP